MASVPEKQTRKEVHEIYGGRRQGGISPSSTSPYVLLFTNPEVGHRHGYYDGMGDDDLFHYTGEGQIGDQRMVQGNKAVLNHATDGRALLVFHTTGKYAELLGECELVYDYLDEAPDTNGDIRQVIRFALKPQNVDAFLSLPRIPNTRSSECRTSVVPIEEMNTERAFVDPSRDSYEFERRESALVNRYADHLRRMGHEVGRLKIVPPDETAPLYSDLWDANELELIEAKGLVTREQVRMAVGQLLDYGRFINHQTKSVLLPSKPRADLIAYTTSLGIDVVYPVGEGWSRN